MKRVVNTSKMAFLEKGAQIRSLAVLRKMKELHDVMDLLESDYLEEHGLMPLYNELGLCIRDLSYELGNK